MELEFDKEIDAILRKNARGPTAAGLSSAHLEPDEIAAFAENALPANARSFYIKHLADCDRCRSVLSQTISLIPEAEHKAASSIIGVEQVAAIKPTWFQKFLAMPSLATAMGAFVIVFVGLIGYVIYQNRLGSQSTEVASVRRSEVANDNRPLADQTVPSANAAASSSNAASNASAPMITSEGSPLNKTMGQSDVATDQPVISGTDQKQPADGEKNEVLREEDRSRAASPPAAEPPAPVTAAPMMKEQPKTADPDAKKLAERKVEDKRDVAKTESADAVTLAKPETPKDGTPQNSVVVQNNQQNVGGAASKSKSGPYRDMQQRNAAPAKSARADDDEAPAGRHAGGKSFEKKEGAWYDSAYRGQPTINIRRGTGEYKILDSGLRNIAESIGGTVVVVWKEKAYRIQ